MKNKNIIKVSIILNLILLIIVFNLLIGNGNIIKERQIIKEMNESTQVTNLNSSINQLNSEHSSYQNYIQTCKTQIATALTNEGVETSDQITLEEMAAKIPNILQARTSDADATAEDIVQGKTAWVNGEKVTGTLTGGSGLTLLKSGQSGNKSIDLTSVLDDYTKYTLADFVFEITSCKVVTSASKDASAPQPPSATATKSPAISYSPSTGIFKTTNCSFTVSKTTTTEYGNSSSSAVVTLTYNIYLIS